jgi:hypothetical protein
MRRGLVVAGVALAAALVTSAYAATAARFFEDPAGDSGAAPDITEVQVGTDVVAGHVVMWVTSENRTEYGADDYGYVYLDTDLNHETGATNRAGAEFAIEFDDTGADLWSWNGTDWQRVPAPTLRGWFLESAKGYRIQIHPSDLGGPRAFNFYVVTLAGDAGDVAPDLEEDVWTYSLETGRLQLTKEDAGASKARAGQLFTVIVVAGREDTFELLGTGRITCSLRIGKTALRPVGSRFVEEIAGCSWRLPRTARGKKLTAKITVSYGGASVSHAVTTTVGK